MGLTVTALCCVRSGRTVLQAVGLAIADGEVLLLRGPNGAGKSTLLRALAGLLPATGRIELDGAGRDADPDAHAERIAYAGHLDAIKPQLTVAENLAFWADLFEAGAIDQALATFDLDALARRPAHLLSAGQKRRLGLARLVLVPRRLWLLDEPTVSLDARSVQRLNAALDTHCAGGGFALVATHAQVGPVGARELVLSAPTAGHPPADPFLAGRWT